MKQFKRFIAMVMAAAMIAGLGVTAGASPTQANAQGTDTTAYETPAAGDTKHTITITGDNVDGKAQKDHNYYAYQIFEGIVSRGTKEQQKKEGDLPMYYTTDPTGVADPSTLETTTTPTTEQQNWPVMETVDDPAARPILTITGWGTGVDPKTIIDGKNLYQALQADDTFLIDDPNSTAVPKPKINAFAGVNSAAGVAKIMKQWRDGAKNEEEAVNPMTGTPAAPTYDPAKNGDEIDAFAKIVAKYVDSNGAKGPFAYTDYVAAVPDDPDTPEDESKPAVPGKYVSPELDQGYYLVLDKGKAADQDDFISKNIIELVGGDVTAAPKGTYPTVDKGVADYDTVPGANTSYNDSTAPTDIVDGDAVQANVGDTVYFTLKGTVSSMIQDFDEYFYQFQDTMSPGLSFGTPATIEDGRLLNLTTSEVAKAKTDAKDAYVGASSNVKDNDATGLEDPATGIDPTKWEGYVLDGATATEYTKNGAQAPSAWKAFADLKVDDTASNPEPLNSTKLAEMKTASDNAATHVADVQKVIAYYEAIVADNTKTAQEVAVAQIHLNQLNNLKGADMPSPATTPNPGLTPAAAGEKVNITVGDTVQEVTIATAESALPSYPGLTGTVAAGDTLPDAQKDAADKKGAYDAANEKWTNALNDLRAAKAAYEQALDDEADRTDLIDRYGPTDATPAGDGTLSAAEVNVLKNYDRSLTNGQPGFDAVQQNLYDQAKEKISNKLNNSNIEVYVHKHGSKTDATKLTNGFDVVVNKTGDPASDQLVVTFNDLKQVTIPGKDSANGENKLQGDDYIVVVYKATVNKDAEVGNPGNDNNAKVVYSRDPSTKDKGESTPDEAKVFTFELDLNKIDKNSKERLLDAGFYLYRTVDKEGNALAEGTVEMAKLIKDDDGKWYVDQWVQVTNFTKNAANIGAVNNNLGTIKFSDYDADAKTGTTVRPIQPTEVLTTEDGRIEIKGLQSGTYYLFESTIPQGYDPPGVDFPMAIEATMAEVAGVEYEKCPNPNNPAYQEKATEDYTDADKAAFRDMKYIKWESRNKAASELTAADYTNNQWPEDDGFSITNEPVMENGQAVAGKYIDQFGDETDQATDVPKVKLTSYKVERVTLNGADFNAAGGAGVANMNNSLDVTLPETGGIGTTIFYIVGGVMVVAAAVVMITRKRVEG